MRRGWFLFACLMFVCTSVSSVLAQSSNSTGTIMWPNNPPVGIGTQTSVGGPRSSLHIHYKPSDPNTDTAIIRLSEGDTTSISVFGILGLMPSPKDTDYTSLARGTDLVLHEHSGGDLILTNFNPGTLTHPSGAIRLATTPNTADLPVVFPHRDIERVTILENGNVGIDMPTDAMTNAGKPMDQLQIGGGARAALGTLIPVPGLTLYGGSPFEAMPLDSGGMTPVDWRYLAFNEWDDHMTNDTARFHRFAALASSRIAFSESTGGLIHLECNPFDSARGMNDFRRSVTFEVTGHNGLSLWSDENDTDRFHHLFDVYRPGYLPWGVTRNTRGLFYHNTPVYIGFDTVGHPLVDFNNFGHVNPDLGDGKTWMLAVNGSALFKEVLVLDTVWSDFVFQPDYKLPSLTDVETYTKTNHHLSGIPSADEIKKNGVQVGETDAKLLQKIEELTLYAIELNKQVEVL